MPKTVRARYEKGVLKLLDPLQLEDGVEVILEVREAPKGSGIRRFFGIIKTREPYSMAEEYYEYVSERGRVP